MTELLPFGRVSERWQLSQLFSCCVRLLTSQALIQNISKCYLTLSWKIERKQRVEDPTWPLLSLLLTSLSLLIPYGRTSEDVRHRRASAANNE